ncbi:hypothetical protein FIU94_02350 [Sulfitobacter sp. THAF37]|nr:hypothetical protein FIU94_02350 [Sulfitobacter sp. THAF37]
MSYLTCLHWRTRAVQRPMERFLWTRAWGASGQWKEIRNLTNAVWDVSCTPSPCAGEHLRRHVMFDMSAWRSLAARSDAPSSFLQGQCRQVMEKTGIQRRPQATILSHFAIPRTGTSEDMSFLTCHPRHIKNDRFALPSRGQAGSTAMRCCRRQSGRGTSGHWRRRPRPDQSSKTASPSHSAISAGVSSPSISMVNRFSRIIFSVPRGRTACSVNRPRRRAPARTGLRNRSLFMP